MPPSRGYSARSATELYRLGEADLHFGELLPQKPGWLEQEEYEERNRVGFQLERLANNGGAVFPRGLIARPDSRDDQ